MQQSENRRDHRLASLVAFRVDGIRYDRWLNRLLSRNTRIVRSGCPPGNAVRDSHRRPVLAHHQLGNSRPTDEFDQHFDLLQIHDLSTIHGVRTASPRQAGSERKARPASRSDQDSYTTPRMMGASKVSMERHLRLRTGGTAGSRQCEDFGNAANPLNKQKPAPEGRGVL